MNNEKEYEFGLENVDIKEEIETSLYCDSIGKDMPKKDSFFADLSVPFSTNDTDSNSFVLPDEVSAFIDKDDASDSVFSDIIPHHSKTAFLTKEMLKENRLFSKASDFDSGKQNSQSNLRTDEIKSENLFKYASEISSNIDFKLEELQVNHSDEICSFTPDNSEPIPYQLPGTVIFDRPISKQIFQELDVNCLPSSKRDLDIQPMISTADDAIQRTPEFLDNSNKNDCDLRVAKPCTNLFQTASDNLKSGKKFAPLFPTAVKKNLKLGETSNSSKLGEKEEENIRNQVTSDPNAESVSTSTKPHLKKPSFKPVFKKPKKIDATLACSSANSSHFNSKSTLIPSKMQEKDCLPVLNEGKEKENYKNCNDSLLDVKKETDIIEADEISVTEPSDFVSACPKVYKQGKTVNKKQVKTVKKINSNSAMTGNASKEREKMEKIVPAKSCKHNIDAFKNKFPYLYSTKANQTKLTNVVNSKNDKNEMKNDKRQANKTVGRKLTKDKNMDEDKTLPSNAKLPIISVKSVENLNSMLISDHKEVKCEFEDNSIKQNEVLLTPEESHDEKPCLSMETSNVNISVDTTSPNSVSLPTNSSICLQDASIHSESSCESTDESEKEVVKPKKKFTLLKKKRLETEVAKRKAKKLKSSKKSEFVDNVEDVEVYKKKLYELQTKTIYPVWVCCDVCNKWRCLRDTIDPTEVPKMWICSLNADENYNSCDAPTEDDNSENILYIFNAYTLGSIVWVTNQGQDWWPAMVDDCPDNLVHYWLEEPYEKPTQYHVTFFGSEATRTWVETRFLRKFDGKLLKTLTTDKKMRKEHAIAISQAVEANRMDLRDRRKKYCFATRRKGEWFLKSVGKRRRQTN